MFFEGLAPLLSEDDFVERMGGKVHPSDPRVKPLLEGASTAIRRYCGWHIAPVLAQTFVEDYEGGRILVLPTLRLKSVDALEVMGRSVDVDDLRVSPNGEIRLDRHMRLGFGDGFGGVEITMTHGYPEGVVADLQAIVQQVVANALSSPLGATVERAGQVSVQWAQTAPGVSGGISILERDFQVIDQYKIGVGA